MLVAWAPCLAASQLQKQTNTEQHALGLGVAPLPFATIENLPYLFCRMV
jgi:hypothetical protein